MRLFIIFPMLALAACQVNKDDGNGTITAEFNQDVAENAAEDVGNFAENLGGAIANEAADAKNKIDNTDVDVKVDTNTADNRN